MMKIDVHPSRRTIQNTPGLPLNANERLAIPSNQPCLGSPKIVVFRHSPVNVVHTPAYVRSHSHTCALTLPHMCAHTLTRVHTCRMPAYRWGNDKSQLV